MGFWLSKDSHSPLVFREPEPIGGNLSIALAMGNCIRIRRYVLLKISATFLFSVKSTYQADLTDDQREWCENQIQEAHRTGFYELTPAECQIVNQHTLENLELGVLLMTVPGNINALGLVLQRAEYEPTLDEEGDPVLNEEGDPVLKLIAEGPYDVTINVKQEGFKDAEGNLIKKGKQNFLVTGQATNRPRNENNWKKYLLKRMTKWMLNGEALIRDLNNCGITEQHRRLAYVVGILEGILDPNYQVFSVFVNGVHPLAAITADTGKPNSATDIIASDPLIVPPSIQVDSVTILNNDPNGNKNVCRGSGKASRSCLHSDTRCCKESPASYAR